MINLKDLFNYYDLNGELPENIIPELFGFPEIPKDYTWDPGIVNSIYSRTKFDFRERDILVSSLIFESDLSVNHSQLTPNQKLILDDSLWTEFFKYFLKSLHYRMRKFQKEDAEILFKVIENSLTIFVEQVHLYWNGSFSNFSKNGIPIVPFKLIYSIFDCWFDYISENSSLLNEVLNNEHYNFFNILSTISRGNKSFEEITDSIFRANDFPILCIESLAFFHGLEEMSIDSQIEILYGK